MKAPEQLPQLTEDECRELRAWAADEGATGNTGVADILKRLTTEGQPSLEEAAPWPTVLPELLRDLLPDAAA
ncbi:hypothetical protein [Streptomyces sp. 7N604]|uniref:hypothetical protein n=1 Tax=Streptomyces sp. 7N604 TaxID=3457415 RepID=UPI003FD1DE44